MLDEQDQLPYKHISDLIREKPVGLRVTSGKRYLVYTYQGKSTRLSLDGWARSIPQIHKRPLKCSRCSMLLPTKAKSAIGHMDADTSGPSQERTQRRDGKPGLCGATIQR